MFNRQKKPVYISPAGQYYTLFADMAAQAHLLIAGETGSGKSVVINGIIYTKLLQCPDKAAFIMIDTKRVELSQYKHVPHCLLYASEPADVVKSLRSALDLINARFMRMSNDGARMYSGGDIYVIIDELADLMTTNKREIMPLLQRICQIGRAAKVHVIAATQCPLAQVIPTPIKVNFTAIVGLHTATAQHSRNILEKTGCELLPQYGQGYYKTPRGTILYNIPMYTEQQQIAMINYWTSKKCLYR